MSRSNVYGRKLMRISDRISEFKIKLVWWGNISLVLYGIKDENRARRTRFEPFSISNDGLYFYSIYSRHFREFNLESNDPTHSSSKLKVIGYDIV